jgi:hypothetical protein
MDIDKIRFRNRIKIIEQKFIQEKKMSFELFIYMTSLNACLSHINSACINKSYTDPEYKDFVLKKCEIINPILANISDIITAYNFTNFISNETLDKYRNIFLSVEYIIKGTCNTFMRCSIRNMFRELKHDICEELYEVYMESKRYKAMLTETAINSEPMLNYQGYFNPYFDNGYQMDFTINRKSSLYNRQVFNNTRLIVAASIIKHLINGGKFEIGYDADRQILHCTLFKSYFNIQLYNLSNDNIPDKKQYELFREDAKHYINGILNDFDYYILYSFLKKTTIHDL